MLDNETDINHSRASIETAIIEIASKRTFTREYKCFDEENVLEFLKLWHDLTFYYRDHEDYDINIEVIREYIDWSRYLGIVSNSESVDDACRDEASDALAELQAHMNEIIKHIEFRLYPDGRQ